MTTIDYEAPFRDDDRWNRNNSVDDWIELYENGEISEADMRALLVGKVSLSQINRVVRANRKPLKFPKKKPIQYREEMPFAFVFQNYLPFLLPAPFYPAAKGPRIGRVILPVTPSEVKITYANNPTTVTTIAGITTQHAGADEPHTISFEGFFPFVDKPRDGLPSYVVPNLSRFGFFNPPVIAKKFYMAAGANQPILFSIVQGVHKRHLGRLLVSPSPYVVTSFETTFKHGHGRDLFYTMELKRWQPQRFRIHRLATATNGQNGNNRPEAPAAKWYLTKHGDTSVRIAHLFLGDSRRWLEIYNLNKQHYTGGGNRQLPDVGVYLRLPAK